MDTFYLHNLMQTPGESLVEIEFESNIISQILAYRLGFIETFEFYQILCLAVHAEIVFKGRLSLRPV